MEGDIFFYTNSFGIWVMLLYNINDNNKQLNNMAMIPKDKVYEFLNSLQWERFNKIGLELELERFFGVPMTLTDSTCEDYTDTDFSFTTTTAQEECASSNFIDIEIYYAKTRKRGYFIITETSLLDYAE